MVEYFDGGIIVDETFATAVPGLFCQVPVSGDVTLEPTTPSRVLKDLVCEKKQKTP